MVSLEFIRTFARYLCVMHPRVRVCDVVRWGGKVLIVNNLECIKQINRNFLIINF